MYQPKIGNVGKHSSLTSETAPVMDLLTYTKQYSGNLSENLSHGNFSKGLPFLILISVTYCRVSESLPRLAIMALDPTGEDFLAYTRTQSDCSRMQAGYCTSTGIPPWPSQGKMLRLFTFSTNCLDQRAWKWEIIMYKVSTSNI